MEKSKDKAIGLPLQEQLPGSVLEELTREGARQLLAQALEVEVAEFVEKHQSKIDAEGRRQSLRRGETPSSSDDGFSRLAAHRPNRKQ